MAGVRKCEERSVFFSLDFGLVGEENEYAAIFGGRRCQVRFCGEVGEVLMFRVRESWCFCFFSYFFLPAWNCLARSHKNGVQGCSCSNLRYYFSHLCTSRS